MKCGQNHEYREGRTREALALREGGRDEGTPRFRWLDGIVTCETGCSTGGGRVTQG